MIGRVKHLTRPQSSLIICTRPQIGRGRLVRHLGEGDVGRDKRDDWGTSQVKHAITQLDYFAFCNLQNRKSTLENRGLSLIERKVKSDKF